MRLTKRCIDLLRLLRVARWLSTSQIHRRFFRGASPGAARRRLRKLVHAGYLSMFQRDRLSECVFTLGREGKHALDAEDGAEVCLERKPPKQLDHLLGINEARIAAELVPSLSYFFACWELPGLGWGHPVIPDAIFSIDRLNFALEYDRGFENTKYFVATKMAAYRQGLGGFPLSQIVVVSDSEARVSSLRRAVGDDCVLYTTVDRLRSAGLPALMSSNGAESVGVCGG